MTVGRQKHPENEASSFALGQTPSLQELKSITSMSEKFAFALDEYQVEANKKIVMAESAAAMTEGALLGLLDDKEIAPEERRKLLNNTIEKGTAYSKEYGAELKELDNVLQSVPARR